MPPHVPYGLRGLPFRLWPKCNRLLRLGRPSGAVTLTLWGGWWYMNMKYLNSTKLPRPWSPWGSSPSRKNPHGRTWNRTQDLMISSQKLTARPRGWFIFILIYSVLQHGHSRPASCSSGRSFWLLIVRSQVRFQVLPWGFFLEGEDPHGDHGLGSLIEFRFKVSAGTSYSCITIHLIGTT
jgi:hypothetical protein